MRNLTCIVCPMGCSLQVEEGPASGDGFPSLNITGNRCPRGAVYAGEEIRSPRRTVTATCGIEGQAKSPHAPRRLPVKTAAPCPREKIPALLADIYQTKVKLPVKAGDMVIAGWKGEEINVIAARTIN